MVRQILYLGLNSLINILNNCYKYIVLIVNVNLLIQNKDGVNGDVGAHVRQIVVVVCKKDFACASLLFHFLVQTLSTANVFQMGQAILKPGFVIPTIA